MLTPLLILIAIIVVLFIVGVNGIAEDDYKARRFLADQYDKRKDE